MPSREAIAAVLIGNVVYFALLPWLPVWAQHHRFQFDWGVGVDFLFCLAIYAFLRALGTSRVRRRP